MSTNIYVGIPSTIHSSYNGIELVCMHRMMIISVGTGKDVDIKDFITFLRCDQHKHLSSTDK